MEWKSRLKKKLKKIPQEEEKRQPIVRCMADEKEGLTSAQVKERREAGWSNKSVEAPTKTVEEIIRDNTFTYFNMIFAVLGLLLCLVGSFRNLTFLPVVIGNTLIGIIQEIRAKKVLEQMNMLNAPHTLAVRDKKTIKIPSEELVIDDIVMFQAGNQICADAVVVNGEVQVNESLLTGESDEIAKKRGDTLMSGSFIVSGTCYARLDKVGADSYISRLTLEAKAMGKGEKSEMIRSLDKLVKSVGVAIIPIGVILFVQSYITNENSLGNSVTAMVAAVIGMIPEGLYLLATVAMAVSSMRLAKQQVLLHEMKSIETLARVNVLCVDKTGTITENRMVVHEVIETDEYKNGNYQTPLPQMLGNFAAAMSEDNATMKVLKETFCETSENSVLSVTAFSSAVKYSSVSFADGAFVLGAPEMVLRDDYVFYKSEIEEQAKRGYRVLVFAEYEGIPDGKPLTGRAKPLAYVTLSNPIRSNAKETFAYFREQDVEIKVISGDNPVTVSEIAVQAGIEDADQYIDASVLKTPEQIREALSEYTVFGRVTPEQKRRFVQELQANGNTVAMTGDGVNDVLALKDADCSIAMASGSEAAAHAAQVVLLDSDFSHMPAVVLEGRRTVNNIERSASLFLVKNIFSLLLAILSAVFAITYPLQPSQVSLIAAFTIGIPGFFLALEPNEKRIEGHFLINVLMKAMPAGLTDVFAVGALVICGEIFELPADDIATAATILLAVVGFMILERTCKPLNKLRKQVLFGNLIGFLFCWLFLGKLFAIGQMSKICVLLAVVFSFAAESVFRYLTLFAEKLAKEMA